MSYEDNAGYEDNYAGEDAPLPEESNNNRTFLIAAGILGGVILIAIACLVGVYLFGSSGRASEQQQAIANATGTAQAAASFINDSLTATFQASILPTTTLTLPPTSTPPVNNSTVTAAATVTLNGPDPATATVAAALTQAAAAQKTVIPTTTALPNTGFMDDFGISGLVVMTLAFMIVILLARKLRSAPFA